MYEAKAQHVPYHRLRADPRRLHGRPPGPARRPASRHRPTASSCCTTNRRSAPRPASCTASRPWSVGTTRPAVCSARRVHPDRRRHGGDPPAHRRGSAPSAVPGPSWFDRGWTIPVSVNISARSLHDVDFPGAVQRQLDAAGVPGAQLSLELTEGAIMTDPGRALLVLEALDAMGIALSIDDFGTGYSSMSYLKDLPVRELKIDRSFVIGHDHRRERPRARPIGRRPRPQPGLHVVAEGVEDAATQRHARPPWVATMQGFHVRRPAPAERSIRGCATTPRLRVPNRPRSPSDHSINWVGDRACRPDG